MQRFWPFKIRSDCASCGQVYQIVDKSIATIGTGQNCRKVSAFDGKNAHALVRSATVYDRNERPVGLYLTKNGSVQIHPP
jgi:hypothetical protein